MHRYAEFALSSAKEALLFNLVGMVVAIVAAFVFGFTVADSFGFALLVEAAGLMLVGGGLGVAGQGTSRKVVELLFRQKTPKDSSTDRLAALYSLTGGILFAEGALLTVIFSL